MAREVKGGRQGEKGVQGDRKATCQERKCVVGGERHSPEPAHPKTEGEKSSVVIYTELMP